jgi:predicted AlkP superfamily pyrophosphatase or phosphodiesterase
VYSNPPGLRDELQAKLGRFPLFKFWGPGASIESSRWIANASMHVWRTCEPTLMLVYLPHLDYALQKLGPGHGDIGKHVAEIDAVIGELLMGLESSGSPRIMMLSEYGIEPVETPIEINRMLRRAGYLAVRDEEGLELLDAGASRAFAVADHQVAHVYVKDAGDIAAVDAICTSDSGIELAMTRKEQTAQGIDHARAGDVVLVARSGAWFNYQYWLDDGRAPDFARTVDIHRKPGYDGLELFVDPKLVWPKVRVAMKVLRKKLGFRMLLDVVPLDAALLRGSHGRTENPRELQPVITGSGIQFPADGAAIPCTAVRDMILSMIFD